MELKIKNISISEFLQKEDPFYYDLLRKEIPAENLFNKKVCSWKDLTFDEMSVIEKISSKKDLTVSDLEVLFGVCYKEENFLTCGIMDFFRAKKYIDKKIIEVVRRKNAMLAGPTDAKLARAGAENLTKFGTLNTKITIGKMFGFRPSVIGTWKYTEVLFIQAHNVTTDLIQRNLSEMT